jgi:hypothetical protein
MLHHPGEIRKSLHTDTDLWPVARRMLGFSLAMAAIYGAAMGATNLLQGSAMSLWGKMAMIPVTAVKVPVLFLLTLAIVIPPVYVSNAFVGSRLSFRQMVASLLTTVAVTATVLGSMATAVFFFALTSRSYEFIKLLHVLFFGYAGLSGLRYLLREVRILLPMGGRPGSGVLAAMWLALYIFVGTQLAWVLRPFVGSPDQQFQLFRPRHGNIYESVYYSVRDLVE